MPGKLGRALVTLSAAALVSWVLAAPVRADAISDWNAKAEAIATEKQSSRLSRAQSLAIVHVAIFEAINALELRNDSAPGTAPVIMPQPLINRPQPVLRSRVPR
jgi:hypothetical protein